MIFVDSDFSIVDGNIVHYLDIEPKETRPRPLYPWYPEIHKHSRTKKPRGQMRKYHKAMAEYQRAWPIWLAEQSTWWLHKYYCKAQPIGPIAVNAGVTMAELHSWAVANRDF